MVQGLGFNLQHDPVLVHSLYTRHNIIRKGRMRGRRGKRTQIMGTINPMPNWYQIYTGTSMKTINPIMGSKPS